MAAHLLATSVEYERGYLHGSTYMTDETCKADTHDRDWQGSCVRIHVT